MKVTKALLEKYHQGHCSAEEKVLVEDWLLDDEVEESNSVFSDEHARANMKKSIWRGIQPTLPFYRRKIAWYAAAAAILLFIFVRFVQKDTSLTSTSAIGEVSSPGFTIELGKESNASFQKDTISFRGTIKIVSQKNSILSFHTVCTDGTIRTKSIHVNEGESYIALHYKDKESSEMLVINENMLFELPPIIKNQLSEQFKI